MKKAIALTICMIMVFACGCGNTAPDNGNVTNPESTSSPATSSAPTTEESTEPDSTEPPDNTTEEESFSEPEAEQVITQKAKGCYYGNRTGTEQTFTGLEPLPLTDFGNPSFENTKNLPNTSISHSYGVAKDETPHTISVENQKFFDEKGYDAICYDAKTTEKIVYLTFDCGYENGYTAKILDTLRDKDVKAAFFCTLPEMRENAVLIARMINEGHIVGNHSVTHPDFSGLPREKMYEEVKGFDDYIREHFGYSSMYFRYPQGKYSENSLDMLNQMGFTCVFWSLAYADWDLNDQKGPDYALETVMSRLHPGAVILLHAVSPDNANALPVIIDAIRAKGYSFRALSDYRN